MLRGDVDISDRDRCAPLRVRAQRWSALHLSAPIRGRPRTERCHSRVRAAQRSPSLRSAMFLSIEQNKNEPAVEVPYEEPDELDHDEREYNKFELVRVDNFRDCGASTVCSLSGCECSDMS
jgi:hypothetical protein